MAGPERGRVVYRDQTGYRQGVGFVTKAVALPDDVASPGIPKASGVVRLPRRVHWWEPFRAYDLDDPLDRQAVYREVLDNGTPDDVRWFIDVEKLVEMWDRVVLPSHIVSVWEPWLRDRGFLPQTP